MENDPMQAWAHQQELEHRYFEEIENDERD